MLLIFVYLVKFFRHNLYDINQRIRLPVPAYILTLLLVSIVLCSYIIWGIPGSIFVLRPARDRGEALCGSARDLHDAVRRQAVNRQTLRAHGRGRDAVLLHRGQRHPGGPNGDGAAPRFTGAGAGELGSGSPVHGREGRG